MTLVYKFVLSKAKNNDYKIRPFILIDCDENNYIFYKVQSGYTTSLEQNKRLYLKLKKDLCFKNTSFIAVNQIKYLSKKINLDIEKYIFKCPNNKCLKCKELKFNNKKIKQVSIKDNYAKFLKKEVENMRNKLNVKLIDDDTFTEDEFKELNK